MQLKEQVHRLKLQAAEAERLKQEAEAAEQRKKLAEQSTAPATVVERLDKIEKLILEPQSARKSTSSVPSLTAENV